MTRGKGEGSIYRDGTLWRASIELPPRNGKRRRKKVSGKTKAEVLKKMRALQRELDRTGDLETSSPTVEAWMHVWFTKVALKKNRPRTTNNWHGLIQNHILPVIGSKRLEKLTPADVIAVHERLTEDLGRSSTTALQVHRVLSNALKYAERQGKATRNVATLVDAPQVAASHTSALTIDEGLQVLDTAEHDPLGTLWAAFLLTGAREGELLGFQPDRIRDTVILGERGHAMELSWQLQRFIWQHGCEGKNAAKKKIYACGRKRGTDCPQRWVPIPPKHEAVNLVGGLWLARPKTKSGWRTPPLVEPLKSMVAAHIAATKDEPNPHGLVWRMPDGSPIDPAVCNRMWHDLLDRAGVPQVRLHDARHTAVDLLLFAGVPSDVIKDIVGHSSRLQSEDYRTRAVTPRHVAAMRSVPEMLAARRLELGPPMESAV
ncbi:tyrosine recombinase XerC [Leifsonia sp. TF02-11]|uniref:site-specific integrase n=1 Tax=Leifsonia sp. TF02-11 TaxID=2815212 RepID=UPI001AA11C49|nr:tyrosine-type recombinase/integrase [Leifsonia sp. TF02-11]MBO1739714.1 tyrosine-type recombinase/integrase [Leifsonia sp. TF02-11]